MEIKLSSQSQGVLSMAIASVFFFLMSILVKSCEGLPLSQIVFFRALVAIVICIIQLKYLKVSPWGTHRKYLVARGFFGTFALIIFFATLHKIPLATAVTIQYLSPIFTTLLTALLLKEKFLKGQTIFFLCAFLGVVVIKGPQGGYSSALLLGVLGAFFAACAYTTIRKIQHLGGEHPLVIIFYFPLVTIPIIGPKMVLDWVSPNSIQWMYLIAIGVVVQIAQYFMTKAYQQGEGSVVSIAGYLGVIWASLGGYFLFNESINSSTLSGILLILGSVVGNTIYKAKSVASNN